MTTDDLTHDHLRALLAEQTARAERAEAERDEARAISETWIVSGGAANMRANEALAACAEMRAALEGVMRANNAFHEQECNQDPCTCWVVEARVALSRPDLGAGMVVVGREVAEQALCALLETPANRRTRTARVEAGRALRDALLDKKGGE